MADVKWSGIDYGVKDENGDWIASVSTDERDNLGGYKWHEGQEVYTFNNDGKTNVVAYKEDIPTWIDLNKDTGAIKINAPDIILNSESYQKTIKPLLTQLSSAYKTNKDYKMPNPFDDNDKAEYSVEEVIRKIQDGINNQQIALGQYARTKDAVAQRIGEKAKDRLTPERYAILMANGLSGKGDDIISIPKSVSQNLRWKNFFEMADSFNGTEMTAKDFQDVYYHVDAGRDILNLGYDNAHEMKEWVRKKLAAMESMGVDNMSDEDFDEYLRLQAFNNYLTGTEPRQDVVNSFIEQVWAIPEGFARGTADFTSGIVSLTDGIWNRLWGLEEGSEAYKRFGNPLSKDVELMTTIAANAISIPTGSGAIASDDLVTTGHVSSELRKLYDERAQYYVDTNSEAATFFMIGYTGGKIAANIMAGKAISGAILGSYARWLAIRNYDKVQAAALLENGFDAFPETVGLASGGGTMATGHVMSGTEAINTLITGTANPNMFQLISGLSNINPADVVNMSKLTVGMAAESQSTLALVQAFKNMLETNKNLKIAGKLLTIGDLLAQTTLDTALQDPVATRKILEGSYTDEELSVVWDNVAWNFSGYLGSLLIGKMISSFPNTATGKAANEAATRKLWQLEGWLSDRRDVMKEKIFGDDWLNNIKNPGKKQVARYKWILNKAGENIAKSGGDIASTMKMGKVGQTTQEAIRQMRAVENAIAQKEAGVGVKLREFRSDAHPAINNSMTQLENSTSELAKLVTDAGYKPASSNVKIGGMDPNMGFPTELNNYTGSLYYKKLLDNKLKANNSVISYEDEKLVFPGTAKFTDAQKRAYPVLEANIKRYEEMFPKNITDYVKSTYIPNLYSASVAIRSHRSDPKVSLDLSEEIEGFIATGIWGEKGDEFIPMMRITEAQKEYAEELNRNFQKTEKTGFIRNRNKGPEAIQWGSEADFVNPTLAVERYLTQTAYEEINQSGLRTVLNTPTIKSTTLFNGEQTGAARTFKNLEPALDKAVNDGLGGVKTKFDKSYIADLVLSEYTVKTDIAKAEAKQKRAEKELKKIAEEAPKINAIDRSRALQTMSNENITNVLNDAYKERAKSGSYLDEYKSAATIEDVLQDKSAYDKFILNSPIGVRRAIKRAVNGYQQLTGTVFSETGNTMRGRLNALVPGCDVYDWGLLGREFTNGLTPEGLYTFKGGTPEVQAYIMSTDDLRKLTGLTSEASYVKNHKNEGDATRVLKELTVENVQGVIPVKRLGDMFIPGSEFGHAGITAITSIEWYKYFDYLDSKGITSVPVAISQLPLPKPVDFGTPEYINRSKSTSELLYERQLAIKDLKEKSALREQWEANDWKTDTGADVREQQQSKNGKKLPGTSKLELLDADIKKAEDLIGQYDKYSIDNSVNDKLGHTSQNITEDMKQMFDEEGYVPLFHNQWDDYGSIEFNAKDNVPTGTGVYTAKNGWGDAYWIAPNKRYTDTYGDHKLIAKIPTESLLTGKELDSVVKDFSAEKQKLIDAGVKEKIQNTYDDLYKKVGEKLGKSDSAIAEEVRAAYADGYITEDESLEMYATKQLNNSNVSSEEKDLYGQFLDYYGYNTKDDYVYKDGAGDYIKDEDVKKYMDLDKYVDDYGHVNSFRAISEKTGKPMIDTSMDELVQANSKGTAYFYYKDVDPEFDQKMLKQLSVQAESEKSVEKAILRKTNDVIKKKTLSELIDIAGKNIDQDKLKKLKDAIDNAKTRVEKAGAYHNLLDNIANENRTIVDALGTTTQDYLARNSKKLSEVTLKDVYDWGGINLKKGNKELLDELGIEVKVKPGEWEKADITRAENVPVHSYGFEPAKAEADTAAAQPWDNDEVSRYRQYVRRSSESGDERGVKYYGERLDEVEAKAKKDYFSKKLASGDLKDGEFFDANFYANPESGRFKIYDSGELYRGGKNEASKGDVTFYTPKQWYAETYDSNVVRNRNPLNTFVYNSENAFESVYYKLSDAVHSTDSYKNATKAEQRAIDDMLLKMNGGPKDFSDVVGGGKTSKQSGKGTPIPQPIQDGFRKFGIDAVEVPEWAFGGKDLGDTGIGHQTEVIVLNKDRLTGSQPVVEVETPKAKAEPETGDSKISEDTLRQYFENFDESVDYTEDSVDSINSINNPYLPAPIDDASLNYEAFRLVSEINPDVITDVNRAMLKANKDAFKASELITKIAQNQKKARIELAATIKFEEASRTLGLPTINSRAKLIGAIDDALDGVTKAILEDENAVKVLDAIMVEQDTEKDVAREYIAMVYLKKHEKEIKQAAQDVFKYDKFKNAVGKMPGTTIAKMENQLSKEIGRCIDSKLDDARNVFVASGGEVVDGDKVLKEIHELMNEIEEAGHDANVVAVRRNGQEELIETDPIVADVFNYHVIDESSNVEKFLNNPVFKGMNRLSRFFQVTISPTSMRNQYIRDPLSMFVGTGGIPIRDGMKHISKELLATYDEQIVKEFSEMFPSEAKYIKENLKEGEKYEEKILESIMATGSSTSPALTKTAFYKDPFEGTNVSENFWGVLNQTKSTIGKIVNKAGDVAEVAHQAREVYLRNAQYAKGLKDGLDAGMSLEDAMEMARFFRDNGTTNFRNELYHLRALSKTVNYFGAAINGYTSFWRLFSLDPVGVSTRLFGGIIVPIIVATGMSLASDENRKRYEGLKEYEKNEQFIFVMNGQVYRIPLPQELSVIINPIRHSVETLYGQDKHAFWELMMTDLLNIGPMKFGDIMDLDRNEFDPDPSILDRFGQLGLSLIDQTMPLAIKTIFSLATGIDTYTGQPINTSYWSFDEDGNRILVGGTQSQFSLKLGKETGWSPSVIAWASKNLFGTVGRDVLDVVLGGASPSTLVSNSLGAMSLTASDYDRTASDWNKKIADLWNQKEAKYLPMYNDYTDQINKENDPEKKQKLINKRKDEMKPFFDQVKNMVKTLNDKYPGMYDRYRFSAVTSLLIFDNGVASGTDAASRERDLQNFYLNRDRARQWMSDLGISASDSDSILGHLEMGKDGTIGVKINNPLEILSAQSLFYGAKDQHVANIATILESGTDSYKNQLKAVKNQITDIYNKGKLTQADYDRIDDIKIDWDKKVIAALAPYVQKYSAESAINNDKVLEYLSDYLYVPDAFKKNNRGYNVTNKSLNYLGNAEDAFKESFIKYAFGVNDNKYEHSWNFSNHKTLGGK